MAMWELVLLIVAIGFISMIEICVILAAVSKMIDMKTDAKIKMMTATFKNEMDYCDKIFEKFFDRVDKWIEKITN